MRTQSSVRSAVSPAIARSTIILGALDSGRRFGDRVLHVVYEPGSESCPEDSLVRHGGKEYGYVISGHLGVRIGFEEYDLGAGDSISFDLSSPHHLWAIGEQPATAIWVVVGKQSDSRVA
jgi:uncharacterized cupin superfamily protein